MTQAQIDAQRAAIEAKVKRRVANVNYTKDKQRLAIAKARLQQNQAAKNDMPRVPDQCGPAGRQRYADCELAQVEVRVDVSARRRRGRKSSAPGTLVGAWLAASLLDERAERDRLAPRINGPRPADDFAVVEAACQLATRRYFGTGSNTERLDHFAMLVEATCGDELGLSTRQIDAVVREALGENADLRGVSAVSRFQVQVVAALGACRWLSLDDDAVRRLVRDAEALARDRGWEPPASDS